MGFGLSGVLPSGVLPWIQQVHVHFSIQATYVINFQKK